MTDRSDETVPVIEERLVVGKRPVVSGRVRVRTETELVEETARMQLMREDVDVERVPINREIERIPEVRTEGDVTIIPVVEEVLVVEKRLILKEELRIVRRATSEDFEVPVTLRKQSATIERLNDESNSTEEDVSK